MEAMYVSFLEIQNSNLFIISEYHIIETFIGSAFRNREDKSPLIVNNTSSKIEDCYLSIPFNVMLCSY